MLLAYCYDLNWADDVGRTAAVDAASIGEMRMALRFLEEGKTHNLPRLSLFANGRVGKIDGQQEAQKKLIAMLAERGFEIPEDPTEIKKIMQNPPPPSPPAYAKSCRKR